MSVPVHVGIIHSLILSVTGDLALADALASATDALTHAADRFDSDAFAIGHFDQPPYETMILTCTGTLID